MSTRNPGEDPKPESREAPLRRNSSPPPQHHDRHQLAEIEKNDYNLNTARYISTAVGEEEIDLKETNAKIVEIQKTIRAAAAMHNEFLGALGLSELP